METKWFFLIWYHHKCPRHLNTYVMGLRPMCICNSFNGGIVWFIKNYALPNWSWISLSRPRTSSGWKLLTFMYSLTPSTLNLPLSSSSTTSRELLSQFSTCSGWRWFGEGAKLKKIAMYWSISFMEISFLKRLVIGKLSLFSGIWNDALMHREGLKGNKW